jgi:hypothetical protein
MSKKQKTQEITNYAVKDIDIDIVIDEIAIDEQEITDDTVKDDNIIFATPQIEEAWTGEKVVAFVKEIAVGEYSENELVTFRLNNGNLHFGRYGAIVKMGYKAEGLYAYPKKK